MTPKLITIAEADDGVRLDRAVQQALHISRREARLAISEGRVRVSGRSCRILTRPLKAGSRLCIEPAGAPQAQTIAGRPSTPPKHGGQRAVRTPTLKVIELDKYWAVVDKPAGLLSEPDRFDGPSVLSVLSAMLAHDGEHQRLWLVHRLDASTSGVMVLARTPRAAATLSKQFAARQVKKHYLALCQGALPEGLTCIDGPIARVQGVRHAVTKKGRVASTRVTTLWRSSGAAPMSLVLAAPKTGRTHQIRVHLAHLGCPIVGDRLYGGPAWLVAPPTPERAERKEAHKVAVSRALLHAARLRVCHPHTHEPLELTSKLPADFHEALGLLGADANTLLNRLEVHYKARPCPQNAKPV